MITKDHYDENSFSFKYGSTYAQYIQSFNLGCLAKEYIDNLEEQNITKK